MYEYIYLSLSLSKVSVPLNAQYKISQIDFRTDFWGWGIMMNSQMAARGVKEAHSKEPYIFSKEPNIHSKEPYIYSKEPYIYSKEP